MTVFLCCPADGSLPTSKEYGKEWINIPMAISLIVALGGLFLLLATCEILPSSPNVISQMGEVTEWISLILLVGGLGAAVILFKCPQKQMNASRQQDPFSSLSSTPSRPKQTQTRPSQVRESVDPPRSTLKSVEEMLRAVVQDEEIGEKMPRRVTDNKKFEDSDYQDICAQARRIESDLHRVRILLGNKNDPKTYERIIKEFGTAEQLLSKCMENFIPLYQKGRYQITPVDPALESAAEIVHGYNEQAAKLNGRIKDIKKETARLLAIVYPDRNSSPFPRLGVVNTPRPMVMLSSAWKKALATQENVT